jgi:hypothetical protein
MLPLPMADGLVGNALLDMYAECGAMEQEAEALDAMAPRHMVGGLGARTR